MAKCFHISGDTTLRHSANVLAEDCEGLIVITRDEYLEFANTNLVSILQSLFEFDLAVFTQVCGMGFLLFLVSHGAGNVARWLGRA